ncbi:phosphomannomutase 1-like [Uloborus diversus]|uniref:phosphomannomutase 1-like n=1 Tax=Uloborus diversus TaxID=327109 RepID=UPI00240A5558|nr:phosphomannomutase 1-like [Uloborus diversus]
MGREKILFLFDIDGTLTRSRQDVTAKMKTFLTELCQRVPVGLVGGSDLAKIGEQMGDGLDVVKSYEYVFAENGLVAYKKGTCIGKQSILDFMGEEKLQTFINYCLQYMSKITLPVKSHQSTSICECGTTVDDV